MALTFLLMPLGGCTSGTVPPDVGTPSEEVVYPEYDYSRYSMESYTAPVWAGSRVGNETVMFVGDEGVPLAYRDVTIESVRSYDLNTEYDASDYEVRDGKLYRKEGSLMPFLALSDYYPSERKEGLTLDKKGGGYIAYSEGSRFSSRQVAVTYTHKDAWKGFVPSGASDKMKSFLDRIRSGRSTQIIFFGDSITAGFNASGTIGYGPYADRYSEQVAEYLKKRFSNNRVSYLNEAVGGTNSAWGFSNVVEKMQTATLDLAIVAFGMNDTGYSASMHAGYARNMADAILTANPDACVVFVSTMLPNPEASGFSAGQDAFEAELYKVAEEFESVAVAPVTSMHKSLLEQKRYFDMTGNNVNHPNDFMMRIYAQVILKTILGDEYIPLSV